jgi:hypothetical protein
MHIFGPSIYSIKAMACPATALVLDPKRCAKPHHDKNMYINLFDIKQHAIGLCGTHTLFLNNKSIMRVGAAYVTPKSGITGLTLYSVHHCYLRHAHSCRPRC